MFKFGNFIFDNLPEYFKDQDTYKDQDGKGIWERYLSIFGEDLDDVFLELVVALPEIYNPLVSNDILNNILSPSSAEEGKYLNHISYTLARPLDPLRGEEFYRNLLTMVISLYKIRGTEPSYKLWMAMIGIQIEIFEIRPVQFYYDSGYTYDSQYITELTTDNLIYDTDCPTCSDYILLVDGVPDTWQDGTGISETSIQLIDKIICLNEPINAKLRFLVYTLSFQDTVPSCMNETITIDFIEGGTYDDGFTQFDENFEYDGDSTVVTSQIITYTCPSQGEFDDQEFDNQEFNV